MNNTQLETQRPSGSPGTFVVSLDFELAWGTRGRPASSRVGPWLDGARDAIRQMLDLFAEFEISATWATVGALLMAQPGGQKRHRMLAASRYDDVPTGDHLTAPNWYAEDVLQWILDCPVPQELACHTLTHLYVNTKPEGRQEFADELDLFIELFDELKLPRPRSFVYPKAYQAHFDLLADRDFYAYRGPEARWFESLPGTLPAAALRWIDCACALTPQVRNCEFIANNLWMIPASQFYSPFMGVGKHVSLDARIAKAVRGLNLAARQGGIYHLWTHPFNMGFDTDELMKGLHAILCETQKLCESGLLYKSSMSTVVRRATHIPNSLPPSSPIK